MILFAATASGAGACLPHAASTPAGFPCPDERRREFSNVKVITKHAEQDDYSRGKKYKIKSCRQ